MFARVAGGLDVAITSVDDELHEHFADPVRVRDGRYLGPEAPGYGIEMHPASPAEFAFPGSAAWAASG